MMTYFQYFSLLFFPSKNIYTFTGKERDEETGYSYFGARYYDSDLSGLFLSVDPMADKYPSLSPYVYCAWNPIKATDPNGMDSIHTPIGIANAGPGYKVTEDGQYLYCDGLQTKKWNPNLEIGGVVGDEYRGGYEDYFGPPIDFNCINSGETIPIKLNNEASTVSCTIPVFISPSFGAFFLEIVTASGNALATAVSSLLIIPACLLFSSDSSPNQNAVRCGHDTNIRKSTKAKHEKGDQRRIQDQQGSKGERKIKGKRPKGHKGPWPPKKKQ